MYTLEPLQVATELFVYTVRSLWMKFALVHMLSEYLMLHLGSIPRSYKVKMLYLDSDDSFISILKSMHVLICQQNNVVH